MKFTVVRTTVVTTKELHEVEIAGYLDPLAYIGEKEPIATITEHESKVDIFRRQDKE